MAETDIGPEGPAATIAGPTPRATGSTGPKRPTSLGWWGDWLVIAVPAVTSFVVGGYEIGGPSLWRDEAYTKDAIGRPLGQIFALLGHMDAVHGGYYVLMHFIAAVAGTSATALRFPSLCAMVVATAFTAAIGRRAAALAQAPQAGGAGRASIPALTGLLSGMVCSFNSTLRGRPLGRRLIVAGRSTPSLVETWGRSSPSIISPSRCQVVRIHRIWYRT